MPVGGHLDLRLFCGDGSTQEFMPLCVMGVIDLSLVLGRGSFGGCIGFWRRPVVRVYGEFTLFGLVVGLYFWWEVIIAELNAVVGRICVLEGLGGWVGGLTKKESWQELGVAVDVGFKQRLG